MSATDRWAQAIVFEQDPDGQPALTSVVHHIRCAVVEAGFVSRGRITRGLKEAYGPFELDQSALARKIDEALELLCLSGDIDEFGTSAGRGYAPTPPRRVAWGGNEVAVLGATIVASSPIIVRRMVATETDESLMNVRLDDELGWPDWRSMLVELGSADTSEDNATALFKLAQALATSGERYSLDEPQQVAVVSGRGEFFGKPENAPSGRWHRIDGDGCFPAAVRTGYTTRYVVLSVSGRGATLWQPPTRDVWRWVVVGATLAQGDPVVRYDPTSGALDFLTPPPRQAERVALLTGSQTGSWSWLIDDKAHGTLARIMGTMP
jgi:hypothetical protein